MAELKTKPNDQDVEQFLNTVLDSKRREDCYAVLRLMQAITKEQAKMWGSSMIGFGTYHYKYESGHEGDAFLTGFSPRKDNLTIYITSGFEQYEALLQKLGKHKTGKSCLYIKKLVDIDMTVLKALIEKSVEAMRK